MRKSCPLAALLLSLLCPLLPAQSGATASTPPMGWNSWDSYGLTITESQFRGNVEVQRDKLKPFGWNYAVIDEGWYFANPHDRETPPKLIYALDGFGRFTPVPDRFPSAGKAGAAASAQPSAASYQFHVQPEDTGFQALGQWVHAQGLKFGIHIIRGIPKASVERNLPIESSSFHAQDAADTTDVCPWDPTSWGVKDNAAGQAWYDSLLRQYASWGVDFLKVDCIADHPYRVTEIRQIRRAIERSGRPMVLSLSPGPTQLSHAVEVGSLANMWRISNDEWDLWSVPATQDFPQGVKNQFDRLAAWEGYAKPGNWPDADMLPFGELKPAPGDGHPRTSRLTLLEQQTELTLWAIARSPLIIGANLTMMDEPTLKLLTNRDVIRVNQTSGKSTPILHEDNVDVWRAELPGGEAALAVFNTGDTELSFSKPFSDLDPVLGSHAWSGHDAWTGRDLGKVRAIAERIPAHGCVLWMLH